MTRAVLYDANGAPEVLYVAELPDPRPAPDDVLVEVRAVGLNPYDAKARAGIAPVGDVPFPRGIGVDLAGVVIEAGAAAVCIDGSAFAPGDEVLGWGAGTLRERVVVPAAQLARKPADVAWAVAGSLSTPGQTAMACLRVLPVGVSDTVLVSAASGAVGFLLGQLAVALGARVIGTASASNHARLRAAGIEPIDYGPGLAERVRAHAPEGISAVFENHGREAVDAAIELGLPPTRVCAIVDHALTEQLGLVSPGRYERRAEVLQDLVDRVATGSLALPVQQQFALDDVQSAFRLLEGRHLTGKVVITP